MMSGFVFKNLGFLGAITYINGGITPSPTSSRVYCLNDYITFDYVQ